MAEELSDAGPSYRRLPGRGRKTSGWIGLGATVNTIWLTSDHLLLRETVYGLSESYKRFYFRDIQAFIIRRSPRWIAWISIWTILSLVFFFCYVAAGWQRWSWLFFVLPCFVLTMIQLARGPTCVTYLVTAVQRELLGSLNTLRKARRVLKTVVPLIEEKQGKFDSSLLAEPRAGLGVSSRTTRAVIPAAPVTPSIAVRPSRIHLALFIATFIGGCVALWETFRSSAVTLTGAAILLAAIIVLAVITLALQGRRRVSKLVAAFTWTITVGYIAAWILIYTVYSSVFSFQRAAERASRHQRPDVSFELSARGLRQMPGFDYVLLIYGGCSVALGIAGGSALFMSRPRLKVPPPLPAQIGSDRAP